VQAQAGLGQRYRAQGSPGTPVWLVAGIVLLAASLVAVGAVVVFASMGGGSEVAQQPGLTPTPRPTVGVYTVGKQSPGGEPGSTPAPSTDPGAAPALASPGDTGGPLFSPKPPAVQPGAGSTPSGAAAPPSAASTPTAVPAQVAGSEPSPSTAASPSASASPIDRAVADAMRQLTDDKDKVGQLLLLAWVGSSAEEARPALRDLRAGGIVFVQNASSSVEAKAINQRLRQIARDSNLIEPLIAIDHEGGIVQRLKDVKNEGSNWDFGKRNPSDLAACQRGLDHAAVLRDAGFTMNLAPVLDVNNNPANPVIGTRSYSDDPKLVARLGATYIKGLQRGGVAAVGKHFPGHGNTSVDSHLGLPSLPQTVEELNQIELVPFRAAIDADVAGIMSAHIVFPAVDPSGDPATLSRAVMTGLLRDSLGFTGLAVSDDMGAMKAITDNYTPGDAAVRAVQAGVDLLIQSAELGQQQRVRDGLLAAVQDGRISRERLDEAVQRVLTVKAQFGVLGEPLQAGGTCQ
jgi:beta-N-acetylhexosaminidase